MKKPGASPQVNFNFPNERALKAGMRHMMGTPQKSYYEIVDLLARTEVLAFRPSTDSQDRVHYLLEQNESGELTGDFC